MSLSNCTPSAKKININQINANIGMMVDKVKCRNFTFEEDFIVNNKDEI